MYEHNVQNSDKQKVIFFWHQFTNYELISKKNCQQHLFKTLLK